jgi:hypothetical protein
MSGCPASVVIAAHSGSPPACSRTSRIAFALVPELDLLPGIVPSSFHGRRYARNPGQPSWSHGPTIPRAGVFYQKLLEHTVCPTLI